MLLSERIYNCDGCGLHISRDQKAAINNNTTGMAEIDQHKKLV